MKARSSERRRDPAAPNDAQRTPDVIVQPRASYAVLARPLDRQAGDGRALGDLGLGLGDRAQQVAAVRAHPQGRRSFRAGILVRRAIIRGTLQNIDRKSTRLNSSHMSI